MNFASCPHVTSYSHVDYALLIIFLSGLIAHSLWFGIRVSLKPPSQLSNPIAVVEGVAMVIIWLFPFIFVIKHYDWWATALYLAPIVLFFVVALGIVSALWYVKHKTESNVHESLGELAQVR